MDSLDRQCVGSVRAGQGMEAATSSQPHLATTSAIQIQPIYLAAGPTGWDPLFLPPLLSLSFPLSTTESISFFPLVVPIAPTAIGRPPKQG